MCIQHTAFLLNKGSHDRRRGILPPAVSNYCYGLLRSELLGHFRRLPPASEIRLGRNLQKPVCL